MEKLLTETLLLCNAEKSGISENLNYVVSLVNTDLQFKILPDRIGFLETSEKPLTESLFLCTAKYQKKMSFNHYR